MKEHAMRNYIHLADMVTIAGLLMGIASVFVALHEHLVVAAILIVGSMVCDYFDGYIARKRGTDGDFGAALDGFNDFLTYLLSVSVFGYAAGLTSPLALAALFFFITMGALRLARFSVIGVTDGCYEGLPTSFGLLVLPAYFIVHKLGLSVNLLLPLYLIIAVLMVTTVRVKKPGYKTHEDIFEAGERAS